MPITSAGPTTGAASRLAGIDASEIAPLSAAITGMVATKAAAGTASRSAQPGGKPLRCSAFDHTGASRMSPAVASTDSAKPTERLSVGSYSSRPIVAAASAGSAVRLRPVDMAIKATEPITAALSTDAPGPTSTTRPISTRAPPAAANRGPAPAQQQHRETTQQREV